MMDKTKLMKTILVGGALIGITYMLFKQIGSNEAGFLSGIEDDVAAANN